MSLLPHDRLRIGLCPDKVILVRERGRAVTRTAGRLVIPAAADPGQAAWAAPLAALREMLALPEWRGAGAATVVLSNHFVRYLLVPWDDAVADESEMSALAKLRFETRFGPPAADWAVRVSPGDAGAASVASAVDEPLLQALRAAATENGGRLQSIQPYLMAAFNRWRRTLGAGSRWFVLAEPGRLCLALLCGRRWERLHSRSAAGDGVPALAETLARALYLADDESPPAEQLFLHAPAWEGVPPAVAGCEVRRLDLAPRPGIAPGQEAAVSMALVG